MLEIESIKNSYSFIIVTGLILLFLGIFLSGWVKYKTQQSIVRDPRVMARPKKWMWVIGVLSVLACFVFFVVWLLFFKEIDAALN